MLRSSIAVIFLALFLLFAGPPLILHCVITGSPELLFRSAVGAARFAMVICGIKVKVERLENIPPGVCIFIANHTSNADPPAVVGAIPRRVALLGKKEVFKVPIFGTALKLAGFVPVDRANRESAIASVDEALEHLKGGVSYLIFPEGTRSRDGNLLPFKKGPFVAAIHLGLPVVPVVCKGTSRVMPKGKYLSILPGTVEMIILEPIATSGMTYDGRDRLRELVRDQIAEELKR